MGPQDIACCTKDGNDDRLLKFGLCLPARPLLGYLSTYTSRPLGGALPTENGSRLRRDFKASKPKSSAQKKRLRSFSVSLSLDHSLSFGFCRAVLSFLSSRTISHFSRRLLDFGTPGLQLIHAALSQSPSYNKGHFQGKRG